MCENLLVVEAFLKAWRPEALLPEDVEVARALVSWTAAAVLPSKKFAGAWEEVQPGGGEFSPLRPRTLTAVSDIRQ
jgi:hypothetical protein